MESSNSCGDPHASAAIQIVTYDMENKSTPSGVHLNAQIVDAARFQYHAQLGVVDSKV